MTPSDGRTGADHGLNRFGIDSGEGEANCGIIMATDGSFKVFTNGIDVQALQRPEEELSEDQIAQVAMARKLTALAVALSNEQIMAVLYDLAANTDILKLRPENVEAA